MTRTLDYDKAAAVLVDAAYRGDEAAAGLGGITARTVQNYRARLAADPKLSLIFERKRALVEREWVDHFPAVLGAGADFIERATRQGSPKDPAMVHAVAGAMKLLAEIMFVRQMLDARFKDERHAGDAGTDRPQIAAVAVAAILLAIYTMPRMLGAAVNFNSGPGVDIQAQDATARARATNAQSNTAGRLLSSGRGTGDEVSADFTVPAGCNRQTITYEAESTGGFDGWVNFRVPFVDGQGGESLGPAEANDNPTGSGLWTLTPGTYAIEVESWHARWSYELKCR